MVPDLVGVSIDWTWSIAICGIVARLSYVYSKLRSRLQLEKLHRQKEAEINEMRLWFFTYISHEFRTPLTLILSPLSEIISNNSLSANIRKKLMLTYRNSRRLMRLVNQIMSFRMIESGKLQLKVNQLNLVAYCKDIYSSFSNLAEERMISYEFKTPDEPLMVWVDPEKLELILYNLLSNAFKYSRDGGRIRLKIKSNDNEISIAVSDKGEGIKASRLDYIFEPFQRETVKNVGGSGIGLTLVKTW